VLFESGERLVGKFGDVSRNDGLAQVSGQRDKGVQIMNGNQGGG